MNISNSCTTCSLRHRSSDVFYPLKCQYSKGKNKRMNYISVLLFTKLGIAFDQLRNTNKLWLNWHKYQGPYHGADGDWVKLQWLKLHLDRKHCLNNPQIRLHTKLATLYAFISGRKRYKLKNSFIVLLTRETAAIERDVSLKLKTKMKWKCDNKIWKNKQKNITTIAHKSKRIL